MSEAALATGSEWKEMEVDGVRISTVDVFFDRFGSWRFDEFRTAIMASAEQFNSFPTVARILANKPKKYSTGELEKIEKSDKYKPLFLSGPNRPLPPELESITDDQVKQLFISDDLYIGVDFHLKMFRRGNGLWIDQALSAFKRFGVS